MPKAFVYMLASKKRGTLYIGVTSDLLRRMEEHHEGAGSSFVARYGAKRLVYFEEYPLYADAIRRETNLKKWKRAWKLALIEKHNPCWDDLLGGLESLMLDGRVKPGHGEKEELRATTAAGPSALFFINLLSMAGLDPAIHLLK